MFSLEMPFPVSVILISTNGDLSYYSAEIYQNATICAKKGRHKNALHAFSDSLLQLLIAICL
jgi:hypothetical protein